MLNDKKAIWKDLLAFKYGDLKVQFSEDVLRVMDPYGFSIKSSYHWLSKMVNASTFLFIASL